MIGIYVIDKSIHVVRANVDLKRYAKISFIQPNLRLPLNWLINYEVYEICLRNYFLTLLYGFNFYMKRRCNTPSRLNNIFSVIIK